MTDIKKFLKEYDGDELQLMEVCGTHTAEISRNGIIGMISPKIRLISGPGCPVCVTVSDYIDQLIELSKTPQHTVVTFGDMIRVRGSKQSLSDAKADGGRVHMVYSPMETLKLARDYPNQIFVFAAVGFETTIAVYALLLEEALRHGITNLKLLTSLKIMSPVIDWVCRELGKIDGFLAPGHVSVITGSHIYNNLSQKYSVPFVVAGFEGQQILDAIYALVKRHGKSGVFNLYPSAVTETGNQKAQELIQNYFMTFDAAWRGMGIIPESGMVLRDEYIHFDAGSRHLLYDTMENSGCQCTKVLTGEIAPPQCPLFGKQCTSLSPQGACMVSTEGSCYNYYISRA